MPLTNPSVPCPKQVQMTSAKLLDTSNSAAPSLSSHQEAIQAKWTEDSIRQNHETTPVATSKCSSPPRSLSELVTDLGNQSESDNSEPQPH